MLIAISTYIKPLNEVDQHRSAHIAFINTLIADDKLLAAGRMTPATGGLLLSNLDDKEKLTEILKQDPYCVAQVAEYNILQFIPSIVNEAFQALIR